MSATQIVAHAPHCLFERQAGFQADHSEIQGISQASSHAVPAAHARILFLLLVEVNALEWTDTPPSRHCQNAGSTRQIVEPRKGPMSLDPETQGDARTKKHADVCNGYLPPGWLAKRNARWVAPNAATAGATSELYSLMC
jgi:hypothetical protein